MTRENPFAEPDLPSRRFSPAILHVGIYEIGRLVTTWLLLGSSLLCAPSIISQALRAAMVAAEVPLRGKLSAEATHFPPTHSSCTIACKHCYTGINLILSSSNCPVLNPWAKL